MTQTTTPNHTPHMALSNGRGNANNGPLVFLSPRSKGKDAEGKAIDIDVPYFEIARIDPTDGKIKKTEETCREITGDLVTIQFKDREFNGAVTKHTTLYVRDNAQKAEGDTTPVETYSIDLTARIATRSLYNAMLSLTSAKDISIGYYRSKKGFEAFSLNQAGEKVSWKYKLDELPAAEVIKDKKGNTVKTDYSEVDSFFEAELKALAERLGLSKASAPAAAKPAATAASKPAEKAAADDDSVPF